jgi:phage shock protein A
MLLTRLKNVMQGILSLFVKDIERRNPEALLELEQENLRKQIASFNQGLAAHAGLAERLMGQVRKEEAEERELRARTTAHLRAGNKEAAAQLALRLQALSRELAENRSQMQQAEETYKNLVKARDVAVNAARAKIENLKGAINDMRMKSAMAEMNEMAAGMVSEIGGSGDTLSRLHEMVEEERTKAAGRARVARDSLDMTDINLKEAEAQALAEQALAEFAAAEGISLGGESATPVTSTRSMGSGAGKPLADGEQH